MPPKNPERVWLDDKDCIRMNRREFEAMRWILVAMHFSGEAAEELRERLKMIPDGEERMADGLKKVNDVLEDLIGTMTVTQCRQVRNSQGDMVMKLQPRLSPNSTNVLWEKEIARGLIDVAREKCRDCVEDGKSCMQCPLYKLLEAISPMQEYSDLQCPYALSEWE